MTTAEEPQERAYASYEAEGERPNRTVVETQDSRVAHMMSEIGDGIFVAWDSCRLCWTHVSRCTCIGGPTEPEYIAAWRQKYINPAPAKTYPATVFEDGPEAGPEAERSQPLPDPDTELVTQGLGQALEALRAQPAESDLEDVGF